MVILSKEQKVNLIKERKVSLDKTIAVSKPALTSLTSRVAVVIDYSGSMRKMYREGVVQSVLEKLLPIAMKFDDNGEMELWIFDDKFERLPNISLENFYGYVEREILSLGRHMGRTNYGPVMKDVLKKYMAEDYVNIPSYVLFITDGGNDDKAESTQTITVASKYPVFWQFVGIGKESFPFLEKLDDLQGRYVDNANFLKIEDLMDVSDEKLYSQLLNEFPSWLEYQEVKDMLK